MSVRLCTVLNYSAGTASHYILRRILRGEMEIPPLFLVLNANPGMENSKTLEIVERSRRQCADQGIHFVTVLGPNLYRDLLTIATRKPKRLDHPPLFVDKGDGKRGQISQRCTRHYKIEPMDRYLRVWLEETVGIPRTATSIFGHVEKWIGFSADEEQRIREPRRKYIRFRFPLIEMGVTKADIRQWFLDTPGEELPPRSVCNACFANGPSHYRNLRDHQPGDFAQAVAVDAAVRDMSSLGVTKGPAFFSDRLLPVPEVAQLADDPGYELAAEEASCDSGYCFV